MAKPKAEVLIDLNISDALGGLNEFSDRMEATMQATKHSVRGLAMAWEAAIGLTRTIVTNLAKWADAAAEVEKVERGLAAAAKLRGDATGLATKGLIAYNQQIEKKLGIDAEELAMLQKRLLTMGVSVSRIQEATKATIGLAESTGSLESATVAIARAYNGNTKALERWVGKSKDADEALQKASKNYEIVEAQAGTYATQIEVMERGLENLESEMGKAVINNQELVKALGTFNSVVDKITPVLATLVDLYIEIETIPLRIARVYKENNIFALMKFDVESLKGILEDLARVTYPGLAGAIITLSRQFQSSPLLDTELAKIYLGAAAKIDESTGPSNPLLSRLGDEGADSGKKGKIVIPNPKGSRVNPKTPKARPPKFGTGAIGRGSADLANTFTFIDTAGIASELEVMKSGADDFKRIQDQILKDKYDYMRKAADADLARLVKQREHADDTNAALIDQVMRHREGVQFALNMTQQGAQASLGATQQSIELIIGALVNGSKVSSKALGAILADAMIQQGWAFQAQAIALTFEAIANYGSTAWRAAAMGSAAKTLLIAGYALKAKTGGFSTAPSASPGGGGGGVAGGGGGYGGGTAPRDRRNRPEQEPVVYNVSFAGAVVGGDARRISEDLQRLLRDGERRRPGGFR